ncbi:MAG TPA: Holliday junction branch migration protein RuvA [Coriobacteriia bacterium]|nr:Holliday junction branch migration protein RuvA [Coriobacteriia bacterium]
MIASLRGRVIGRDTHGVVLEVSGVGFRVLLSTQSLAALHEGDSEVSLLTSMIIREDSLTLYGFLHSHEQQLFEKLITVSGIGPKVAISALSAFNADALSGIIVDEDVTRLATVPGIGKKTAQRIILELRGVLEKIGGTETAAIKQPAAAAQATEALLGMGFTSAEVTLALEDFKGADTDMAGLIRHGLKRLGAS